MTKEQWAEHYRTVGAHDTRECPECAARRLTKERNKAARVRHSIYTDLGMHRVKGSLGGTYYE
jgi:DNA-directed RNA polymerase subunit RPC12/RpoP